MHYTDNHTMHTDTTHNFEQVSVSCKNPLAHSRVRSKFGFLAEQASPTVTEVAATTITGTDSASLAPRDRLRQQERGHRFSPKSRIVFGD